MKNIKEIIIGQMQNGPETLQDIAISKKNGKDFVIEKNQMKQTIEQLHMPLLDLVVTETKMLTKEARMIRFSSKTGYLPPFEAGQYINVTVEIDGVRTTRPYSISSSPKQRAYYEIVVAKIKNGFVSSYLVDQVKQGDLFEANGPAGVFHYNPVFHYADSVFIAGGSGITPFMSMAKEVLESGMDRKIHLLYGCRDKDVAIFHDELTELAKKHENFTYTLVLSDPKEKCNYKLGFIDKKCIKNSIKDASDKTYYLCGPQVMIDFCSKELESLKVKPKDIRREMFGSRQDIYNEAGWPKTLSGKEVFKLKIGDQEMDALSCESILTALERHMVRVNVSCRSGECSFCRAKLISGKVFTPRGVLLRHADEVFGYIHTCKAYPISDIEIAL